MNPIVKTFANGIRIVYMQGPTHVVYCGYTVGAGTRDESIDTPGMAHFIEHMSFKGTEKRKAWHILNRMEAVGGELNAFTTKEETVYYCACMEQDLERAAELLTDIVFHSTFPQPEIDKEVDVIIDEIESYNDNPSELIFDDFEEMLFAGHPLAGNILGNATALKQYRQSHALEFTKSHYNPNNTVFFVYSGLPWEQVERILDKYLPAQTNKQEAPSVKQPPQAYKPCRVEKIKGTHQAHVAMGMRSVAGNDPDRIALFLLNNILGGPGMNSRLNLSLREHSGLCYNVESNMTSYSDTGVFCIYFGCDQSDADRCHSLCIKELDKLCQDRLTENQLRAAKKQLIGQLGVAGDNFENVALGLGKSWLRYGTYQTRTMLNEKINSIQAVQLQDLAQRYLNPHDISTLLYK